MANLMMKERRKIALVSIGASRGEYSQFSRFMMMTSPGLHYIKQALERDSHDVVIINQPNDSLKMDQIVGQIDAFEPEFVLFNQFFSTRRDVQHFVSRIGERYIIGVGGHDATFHAGSLSGDELQKQYPNVDFIWLGEAESSISRYIEGIKKKNSIPALAGSLKERIESLDTLPILTHDDYSGDVGFLVSSRGCFTQGCDFCTTPSFYRGGWRARTVGNVAFELENLVKASKKYIFVCDDNFLGFSNEDLFRGHSIIQDAKRHGLKLMIMTTKEQIIKADTAGYLREWRGTVYRCFLGIENSESEALRQIGKVCNYRNHIRDCSSAINALYRNGIALFAGYINFNPWSSFSDLSNSAAFLFNNCMEAANFTNLCQGLRVYDGTALQRRLLSLGIPYSINGNDYSYGFLDKRVGLMYELLKSARADITDRMDNLGYEITDLVYLNQLQESQAGVEYAELRGLINQSNYTFFMELLKHFESSCTNPQRTVDEFKRRSEILFARYQALRGRIRDSAKYQ